MRNATQPAAKGNIEMNTYNLRTLLVGIFATTALAVGVGAQTSPHAGHAPAAKSPETAPLAGPKADMKADCETMMAKKGEMQVKLQEMDVALDKLVAEMNAAKGSKEADAMEKPMAAVINELVAQRKASHSMTKEMDAAMMAHMMGHMDMHGTKGEMECPMMKGGMTH